MKRLVTVRQTLKRIYTDYDIVLKPVFRFLLCLVCLALLNAKIGYNSTVCRPLYLILAAALSAVFPAGFISLICTVFILANMYTASLSLFLLAAVLFLFTVFLYLGFRPGKGILIILIPLGFLLKMPYVFPVILGLSAGLSALVPVSVGVIAWKFIEYLSSGRESLVFTTNIETVISDFLKIIKEVFTDRTLYITLIAFILCIVLTAFIKHLNINHSWTISVIAGTVLVSAVRIGGLYAVGLKPELSSELLAFVSALLISLGYELLFYAVDFRATEHLQFEDDDYFYYVKAVPKINGEDEAERRE